MNDNTKELLYNGIPAYVKESGIASGIMTKLYPNRTKETVQIDEDFNEMVVNLSNMTKKLFILASFVYQVAHDLDPSL